MSGPQGRPSSTREAAVERSKGDLAPAMRLAREDSLLLVVDVQRRLVPAVQDHRRVIARIEALLDAAALFDIPKLATEHCAQKIGELVEPLRSRFRPDEIVAKTAFAATDEPPFVARLRTGGRRQAVMAGMEAHVCVMQTALGLRAAGFEVVIADDAVGSRPAAQRNRELALARLSAAGCVIAGTETVLFEWTRCATDESLRTVLAMVKRF
jgi:nicotinamidase-related amidase